MSNRLKIFTGYLLVAGLTLSLPSLTLAKLNGEQNSAKAEKPVVTEQAELAAGPKEAFFTEAEKKLIESIKKHTLELQGSELREFDELRESELREFKEFKQELKLIEFRAGEILSQKLKNPKLLAKALEKEGRGEIETMGKIVTLLEQFEAEVKSETKAVSLNREEYDYLTAYLEAHFFDFYQKFDPAKGDLALLEKLRGILNFPDFELEDPKTEAELAEEERLMEYYAEEQLKLGEEYRRELKESTAQILKKITGNEDLSSLVIELDEFKRGKRMQVLRKVFALVQETQGISKPDLSTLESFLRTHTLKSVYPELQAFWKEIKRYFEHQRAQNEVSNVTSGELNSYYWGNGWLKAIQYALKHAKYPDYNQKYKSWRGKGGDCANFVSQALSAGGLSQEHNPNNKDDKYNWYYKDYYNQSRSWRGAAAFENFWGQKTSFKVFTIQDILDYENFKQIFSQYKPGDVIQLLRKNKENGSWEEYHTWIITGKTSWWRWWNKDLYISGHTTDRRNESLREIVESQKRKGYKLKFFSIK